MAALVLAAWAGGAGMNFADTASVVAITPGGGSFPNGTVVVIGQPISGSASSATTRMGAGLIPAAGFDQGDQPQPCPGDATGDGIVDLPDLLAVIADWGTAGAGIQGDVDGNGIVDLEDLLTVIANWGINCV